jgi:hypothetical protein
MSAEFLKQLVAECSTSDRTGVGPQRQHSCTSGIRVQQTNRNAT